MSVSIKAIPVRQNKQDFLIGVFSIREIFKFTRYTKRLIVGYDEEEKPIYNKEIQRNIENARVQKIADFLIHDPDATFPTNIVLHIPTEVINNYNVLDERQVEIDLESRVFEELSKKDGDVFITIIDGQHRIRGIEVAISRLEEDIFTIGKTLRKSHSDELSQQLEKYQNRLEDLRKIELVVTFFIDKTLEYQAMIFSTINRTQKRVSQNLVYSLFGLDTSDTPQKTSLQVVLSLNGHPESPFYKRIKLYGESYIGGENPPLTQATMVKSIVSRISENLRESEKDRYKSRKELLDRSPGSKKFLPFRKYYAADNDFFISDIIFFYFFEIRKVFVFDSNDRENISYWDYEESVPKNILQTAVGYDSLMNILDDLLGEVSINHTIDYQFSQNVFYDKYLRKLSSLDITNINRYSFNQRGKRFFYLDMHLAIWPPNSRSDQRILDLNELEAKDS